MNESLPHLGAALFGHILGTAWAGYRTSSTKSFERDYQRFIANGPCRTDLMVPSWWDMRMQHTVRTSLSRHRIILLNQ
jgi:hypothetical protein